MSNISFDDEEKLRLYVQAKFAVHDCVEAGCSLNPQGQHIPDEGEPQRRPGWSSKYKRLWELVHGQPFPEA